MANVKLKDDLKHCLINFDKRILLTDLLQKYELPYNEVDKTLAEYIDQQEKKGKKFEKRFLVHGEQKDDKTEVFTIANGETKMQEWLRKLKNAEASLYSVEFAGGSKAPAQIFKPVTKYGIELKNIEQRVSLTKTYAQANGSEKKFVLKTETKAATTAKSEIKPATKIEAKLKTKHDEKSSTKVDKTPPDIKIESKSTKSNINDDNKKPSPGNKKSTPEKKKIATKTNNTQKKGINSFFGPAGANKKQENEDTKAKSVVKPPTEKKMNDFFKKQIEKPIEKKIEQTPVNTSVQLFTVEEVESSSDEEEKMDALKRDILNSDEEDNAATGSNIKRRRIVDSDSDEDDPSGEPQKKQDKKDVDNEVMESDKIEVSDEEAVEEAPKSETFLDEDGFVMTIKTKKSLVRAKTTKKTPPRKSPRKVANKSPAKSKISPGTTAAKTKQGNIMSFFGKK